SGRVDCRSLVRVLFFFFSGRRRHTRSYGDWSSDVCSSDLTSLQPVPLGDVYLAADNDVAVALRMDSYLADGARTGIPIGVYHARSEERRVGKECRSVGARDLQKQKISTESGDHIATHNKAV